MTTTSLPPLSHVHALADDLIRALAEHPGDDDAVRGILLRWLDQLGSRDLGLVCMAAVRATFGDCLTPHHPDDLPSGALIVDPTKAGATP